MSDPPPKPLITRGKVLRLLTGISNTSALVFSTFLGVHLASPILAAFGGGELASQVMLLGRAYYHPLEPYLIFGPLVLHLTSSMARRLLLSSMSGWKLPRPTVHMVSGYALIPFILPHLALHRLIPMDPTPPIRALSPSELDFSYVAYALHKWPWTSWGGYLGITALGLMHGMGGWKRISSWLGYRWPAPKAGGGASLAGTKRWLSKKGTMGVVLGVWVGTMVLVTVGLLRIQSEASLVRPAMARRIDAVFSKVPWPHF